MGNSLARDPNRLDFKGIHTEQFSDNIPYLNKLQKDSQLLSDKLLTLNNKNAVKNREMYNMFTAQNSEINFSDTSPHDNNSNINNSETSAVNSDIRQLLSKIQKGGSMEVNKNQPTEFINNNLIEQLLTESYQNQVGGNNEYSFLNEDMLKNLMTESNMVNSNEQSGGFFWNKKKNNNETFINEETFKNLMNNSVDDSNATSELNTEFNKYMNNAVTELTSSLENQKGGNLLSSIEKYSSSNSNSNSSSNSNSKNISSSDTVNNSESTELNMKGRNDYESSSAHSNEIDSSNSNISTTVSENNDRYLSDSINTSDINMISVE